METALVTLVLNIPGMAELIGRRMYALELPQRSKKPAVVYQRVGGKPDYDMEGMTGLVDSRFFVWIYGERTGGLSAYKQAKQVRDLIYNHLSRRPGFRDKIGDIEIQSAIVNDEDDRRMDSATGAGVARVQLDLSFWHRKTER